MYIKFLKKGGEKGNSMAMWTFLQTPPPPPFWLSKIKEYNKPDNVQTPELVSWLFVSWLLIHIWFTKNVGWLTSYVVKHCWLKRAKRSRWRDPHYGLHPHLSISDTADRWLLQARGAPNRSMIKLQKLHFWRDSIYQCQYTVNDFHWITTSFVI